VQDHCRRDIPPVILATRPIGGFKLRFLKQAIQPNTATFPQPYGLPSRAAVPCSWSQYPFHWSHIRQCRKQNMFRQLARHVSLCGS
jgi:hypothetical protein